MVKCSRTSQTSSIKEIYGHVFKYSVPENRLVSPNWEHSLPVPLTIFCLNQDPQ